MKSRNDSDVRGVSPWAVIILAAGQGTRMRSDLPKVLHTLGGKSLLSHVVDTATQLDAARICVVYGHGGEQVRATLPDLPVVWMEQRPQLGTGHAVAQALPHLQRGDTVLILYGDVPLIQPDTLRTLVTAAVSFSDTSTGALAILTLKLPDPFGYGRIVRDELGQVVSIVEEKDATPEQRRICEVNTGILAVNEARLADWISRLDNHNAAGEYYLTDIVGLAVADGVPVHTVQPNTVIEVLGVNHRAQLAELERTYQARRAQELLYAGVTLRDPTRFDVRGTLEVGRDVEIDIDVVLEGQVRLGDRVRIGPYCHLKNVTIANDTEVRSHSSLEGVTIGTGCIIGPFARLRPGTDLGSRVHVGNFVEIKQTQVNDGSKINHLSYVGDAVIGRGVNVGAGTITCNYDGANKHRTVIGDHAFIGSDTALVAPVEIGANATIGAGSVITRDAPSGELTLSRSRQETYPGWTRPVKKK
ncbi:fused N-acetylglucosamine-1-phosphate uridyltransferase and glucosamine-1-phosphate acetyltransferase [Gammaproteobacteria bacterium]